MTFIISQKKIVKKYGFKPVIEKGYKFEKQETITQSNQTDAEFVVKWNGQLVNAK